jgi:hypothetical protein
MMSGRPPGAEPGDQIMEAVVPLAVDGRDIDVTVGSYLLAGPGSATGAGLAVAGAVAAAAVAASRRFRLTAVLVLVAALPALGLGLVARWSVPAETGPSTALWLLPASAAVAAAVATVAGRAEWRGPRSALLREAAIALARMELALWGWWRREAMIRALIPSDAPTAVDRAVIVVALVVGIGAAAVAGLGIVRASQPAGTVAPAG